MSIWGKKPKAVHLRYNRDFGMLFDTKLNLEIQIVQK